MKISSAISGRLNQRSRDLRSQADAARDRRDWPEACKLYEEYLASTSDDMAIWIQLGHARKESGNLASAEIAYRRGLVLAPGDADAYLQLGHVLKLSGQFDEAFKSYRRAAELDPDGPAADELKSQPVIEPIRPEFSGRAAVHDAAQHRAARLRELGDAARDSRIWQAAAGHYRNYLELVPQDAAIWVQLGHACKEMGDVSGAEDAYRNAIGADQKDADSLLHLGRLLQFQGLDDQARLYLARAFRIEPGFECYESLLALDASPEWPIAARQIRDRLVLDISDLLEFVASEGKVTGIQRVQIGLVSAFAKGVDLGPFKGYEVVFASGRDNLVWRVQQSDLERLIDYCSAQSADVARARALVDRLRARSVAVMPSAGSSYVVLGAFWGRANAASFYRSVRAAGARIGPLIHDIFPVTHPELVGGGVVEHFEPQLLRGTAFWDFILTNSTQTARDVKAYIAERGLRALPVASVPLAHRFSMSAGAAIDDSKSKFPGAIRDLTGRPFVLCVGTIEVRKNHIALFHVWKMLKKAGLKPPPLVLVGKIGWRVEDFMEQLKISGMLGNEIRIVEYVADSELGALYDACLFTVLPSLAEGWGLPIGESLDHGKICICSDTGSMREAGGEFARYVDAYSVRALYDAVCELLANPPTRIELEKRIARSFRPRLWSDVADDLVKTTTELCSATTKTSTPPDPRVLGQSQELALRRRPLSVTRDAGRLRTNLENELALVRGWCEPEEKQTWLGSPLGRIELGHEGPKGTHVRLAMLFVSAGWAIDNEIVLTTANDCQTVAVPPGRHFIASVEALVGEGGLVECEIELKGSADPEPPETRRIRVAICAVSFMPPDLTHIPPLRALRFGVPEHMRSGWMSLAQSQAVLGDGWLSREATGARPASGNAKIAFCADGFADETLRIVLDFDSHEVPEGTFLRLAARGGEVSAFRAPAAGPLRTWIECRSGDDGEIELDVKLIWDQAEDRRLPRIELKSLRYGPIGSAEQKLALLEAILLSESDPDEQFDVPDELKVEADHWPDSVKRVLKWMGAAES